MKEDRDEPSEKINLAACCDAQKKPRVPIDARIASETSLEFVAPGRAN